MKILKENGTKSFPLVALALVLAALYLGREILIPLALALLLSFVLTPLVKRLECWRVPRPAAVGIVAVLALSVVGAMSWLAGNQMLDLLSEMPRYRRNIHRKMEALHAPSQTSLGRASDAVKQLSEELASAAEGAEPQARGDRRPMRVEVVEPSAGPLRTASRVAGPLLGVLASAAIVIVFTIFMLLKREDLRNRLIRLVAPGRLSVVTAAMDDAAQRVSRYLLMQFTVNAGFGAAVGAGLSLIGLPNALLWGVLVALLRFIPYVGIVIGTALPILFSLAVFDGWMEPALTVALFVSIEIVVANFVEPWLYGVHTGISSFAILVAAVFWTTVWGAAGLMLATPLTVCLLVVGRYVPQLEFLTIALSDETVLPPDARFYQRLLASDPAEARAVIHSVLKSMPLLDAYDSVIVPALRMAEEDRHRGGINEKKGRYIIGMLHELIEELSAWEPRPDAGPSCQFSDGRPLSGSRVFCIPAGDEADETAAAMLAQLLEREGSAVITFSAGHEPLPNLRRLIGDGDVVCISAVPPFALLKARRLGRRLREEFPDVKILIGLWNAQPGVDSEKRIGRTLEGELATSFRQAIERLRLLAVRVPA